MKEAVPPSSTIFDLAQSAAPVFVRSLHRLRSRFARLSDPFPSHCCSRDGAAREFIRRAVVRLVSLWFVQ